MCLIAWNRPSAAPDTLLLAANRDEFYARPSEALHWWDGGHVLAGRDASAGGTWLGVTRDGRMAALTNHRDPAAARPHAPSRGSLVADFLRGTCSAVDYLDRILPTVAAYNPFNLLVWDGTDMMGLESRHARAFAIAPGVGAVSNADFFTPWPKVERLREGMAQLHGLPRAAQDIALWDLLRNPQLAPDADLPQTGISLEQERMLSAAFIVSPTYGTRASTVLRLGKKELWMEERRYDPSGLLGSAQFSAMLN